MLRLVSLLALLLVAAAAAQPQVPARSRSADVSRGQQLSPSAASRFLSQATLGADYNEIIRTAELGPERWIDEQFDLPPSLHLPFTRELQARAGERSEELLPRIFFRRISWWHQVMLGDDLLRQRVALALSEIFVVSDNVDLLAVIPEGPASFYDVLVRNAFGNYRDLLREVTLHPAMGFYLSHLNNDRSDPATGRFPDENYAREVMQLFSIGLFELNPDGSRNLDARGDPVPTYSNREITEFAKVFTGLGSGAFFGQFGNIGTLDLAAPMRMYENHHEPGPKRLLNGLVVPAGQTGMQDIEAALDNLFHHPNVGPFIGRRLIQRLVTSNPTPEYLARVAAVFADNGQGVRGDLREVVRTILLDPEARRTPTDPTFGHLQEPFVRHVKLARTFNASTPSGIFFNGGAFADFFVRQHVGSAPSVFNFFLPDHRPNDLPPEADLVAPEFEITTTSTILGMANLNDVVTLGGVVSFNPVEELVNDCNEGDCPVAPLVCEEIPADDERPCLPAFFYDFESLRATLDFSIEDRLARTDLDALLDRLDLLLTHGALSDQARQTIQAAVAPFPEQFRARFAIYLMLLSPEYVVSH